MRLAAILIAVVALLGAAGTARAQDEPPSLVLARRVVDEHRGEAHKEKMRVVWPAVEDETPPDGAEVLIVRGYISYELTRMVFRGGKVEAGSVSAARSWFYNQEKGESFGASEFDVDAAQFVLAWNAMRRVLAASDARLEPEPEDAPGGLLAMTGSHESADWICVRRTPDVPPVHCADRWSLSWERDHVRVWDGLREEAAFDLFAKLLPERASLRRKAEVQGWSEFAAAEIRAAARTVSGTVIDRDHEFLDTCLRVLGEAGGESAADAVAALDAALAGLDGSDYYVRSVREDAARAATRLRVRHRWDRDEVVRDLRALPKGTWAAEDQAKWIRRVFREKDPAGWAAYLVDEATRDGARPDDVAAAAAELKSLPVADAGPPLRAMLDRADPYIRLEAALSLHAIDSTSEDAKAAIVKLALDRSIACDQRADLTNRWSRARALDAAMDWGGLDPKTLRAHVIDAEPEDPEFLWMAEYRLAKTPDALTIAEIRGAWRLLLDSARSDRVLAAVRRLVEDKDVASKDRMLAALDRLVAPGAAGASDKIQGDVVARWREHVLRLGELDGPK